MSETCKNCKKPMKFDNEWKEYRYRLYRYICENEDCGVVLIIHVCDNCESSYEEWKD